MADRGRFIVIDGVDGAGKSSQIRLLSEKLSRLGKTVVVTREPGGTEMAEQIRSLFKQPRQESVAAETEAMLAWAARFQHINERIVPALSRGSWVICDRFDASTFAYQIFGRGLDPQTYYHPIARSVFQQCKPDATIVLDLDLDSAQQRCAARGQLDRMDAETSNYFQRVREGFCEYTRQHSFARLVDASGEPASVHQRIFRTMTRIISPLHEPDCARSI